MAACVPRRDVQFPASQFFNAAPPLQALEEVRRARLCVPESAAPCIPRDRRLRERGRLEWVQLCRLRELLVPVAVRARLLAVPASAMFPAV